MVNLTPPCFLHGTLRQYPIGRALDETRKTKTVTGKSGDSPLEHHRHDSSAVDADLLPCGLRHVEVLARRVAPPPVVVGEGVVRGAEVGGRDRHRHALEAPPRVRPVVADDLVALPARCAVAEQGRAQSCRPGAVPGRVQIAVPASSTYKPSTATQRRIGLS